MGQELSPSLDAQPSLAIMTQLSNRFTILPHPYYSATANLKLLNDRTTNTKYILRIITTNNQSEHLKIQELINKKISNKNNFLTKLEQYFFEHEKSYCGNLSKCYLLFNVVQAVAVKDHFLTKESHNNHEQELIRGLHNLTTGLLWLKKMQTPHGNISSQNVFLSKEGFLLTDPWIAPEGADLNHRFPSPEKLMKINNRIQDYDPYASDLFSIGMTILEISKQEKLDKIYKKNYTLNIEVLIDEISKCPYTKLRQILKYILLSSENNRRQYLHDHQMNFNIEQQNAENSRDKKEKNGIRRINVMSNRQNPIRPSPSIIYQNQAPPRNFSRQNKIENVVNAEKRHPLAANQNELLITFGKDRSAQLDQTQLRSKSNTKVNFNYTHNMPMQPIPPSFISLPQFIPSQPPRHLYQPSSNLIPYDYFPKFALNDVPKPPIVSQTSAYQFSNNIQESNTKPKKPSLNDKLNRYYYQHVIKSQNNINIAPQKKLNIPTQPSLPNFSDITSQSQMSKAGSPQADSSRLKHQKQRNDQTPVNYKAPLNSDSNSAEFNQYLHCIDEKINKFQAGVSNAIQNTIMEIQKTSEVVKKESLNTVEDYNKNEKQERRMTQNYLPNSQVIDQSQLSNQSEIKLPESCEPIHKVQNESQKLSDSLLLQIVRQTNRENVIANTASYGVREQKDTLQHEDNQNVLRSINQSQNAEENSRNTIIHGTQLESVSNLAIPEQASSQEESFDSNLEKAEHKGVYCEEYYENGGLYKGIIENGERNGQGIFYYRDGGYYEGQWKDNKMNGFGRLYYQSGDLAYQGQWFKDEFHGRGKIYNDNPQKLTYSFDYKDFESQDLYWKYYEGDLSYDTKEGHGKLVLSNGQFYIGEFKGDRPSGRGHFHLLSKKVIHGIWSRGKLAKEI